MNKLNVLAINTKKRCGKRMNTKGLQEVRENWIKTKRRK